MNRYFSKIRTPIKRQNSENYLLLTLLSFAISVATTRLFLEITGYPQIGSGSLHIAHVLWGGLLLFIAALLPIIFANRWVYVFNALLAGVGVGLFIDEVGKFITQNNDYFYPPAAPIIYAFFLIIVLVYLQVRKSPTKDPRSEFYQALDALEEVLDHDLDENELKDLRNRLEYIANQEDYPNLRLLADKILDFLASKELYIAPDTMSIWERYLEYIRNMGANVIQENTLKAAITGGLFALGAVSLYRVVHLLVNTPINQRGIDSLSTFGSFETSQSTLIYWFFLRIIMEGFIGLLLLFSAYKIQTGKIKSGLSLGYYGLLASLTIVNLLIFYFDQFSTILPATIQFFLLLGVIHYRRVFVVNRL